MEHLKLAQHMNRRDFLCRSGCGLGAAAMAMLTNSNAAGATTAHNTQAEMGPMPHFAPKAKRVNYMLQS